MEIIVYGLLAFTSVIGLTVVMWRTWVVRWNRVIPPATVAAMIECRNEDDRKKLQGACEAQPSPLGRLALQVINHLDWPREDNEGSLETYARHEIVKLERGLVVLEVIVGIAPLLGLVGTILGMMNVFGDIGQTGLNNMNDASKLASGISLILRATLVGLLISIPSLIAWSYFTKKVEVMAVELETLCDGFIRRQYRDRNS